MREIKFRAWESVHEKIVHVTQLHFIDKGACVEWDAFEEVGWSLDDLVLMQYTGLKEGNGKEIYEGDIVSFTVFDAFGDDKQFKGVIKYQSGIYEIWKNNDSEYFGSNGAFILNHVWLQDDEFEIIGNIFENPELLEVEANA